MKVYILLGRKPTEVPVLSRCRVLLFAAVAVLFSVVPAFALSPSVHHPLDALAPEEYWAIYNTLHDAGKLTEKTIFASVLLHEPAKAYVLAWKPGDAITREADVVLLTEGKTYEALVDVAGKKLESYKQINEQAPLAESEMHGYDDVIKSDPRVIEALKKRGITDLRFVSCDVTSAGYVGLPEQTDGRRIGWGGCLYSKDATFAWDREIPGMFFVMDMTARKIVRFSDYGIAPMPEKSSSIYDADGGPAIKGTKPILISQPDGPSFKIENGEVSWQNWNFHFRLDPRLGAVLNLVNIKDGDKKRSVMYEGALSEMFVPYQDPEETWNSHVFIDAGEYFSNTGSGGIIKPLQPGVDCPPYATFVSGTFFHENGAPYIRPQLACIFERVTGDPAWRHWDEDTYAVSGRPTRELVVRTVATVSNYDYIFDWRFEQNGSIVVGVAATGILEVKGVPDQKASDTPSDKMVGKDTDGKPVYFGQLVAPGTDAVDHDHFFSYRLDLDVDGQNNSLMVDKLVPYKLPDAQPGRHWIWAMKPEMPATEGEAKLNVSLEHPAMWRFANENVKNSLGQSTSYEIMAGPTEISLLPPTEWPQKRATFSEHSLWVTPYDSNERYAAGTYILGSKGTDGLAAWTSKNRNIMNTDIVAWYTVGFHHVPRPEDWPQMPVMWHTFEIRPYQFFTKNPTMDLPMNP